MPDVVIIGAGLAGLSCAIKVLKHGYSVLLLEAEEEAGGRVRTDRVDGFLLDRGFLVFHTAYSEAQRLLEFDDLDLKSFYPGALIRFEGRFHRMTDPWKRPLRALETLLSPVGSLADKLRIARLRHRVTSGSLEELYRRPETTLLQALQGYGFSSRIIERFFQPFFSGVFFDPELDVSSRAFEFVMRAFAAGDTTLPAKGMGAISRQLVSRLPEGTLRTNTKVEALAERSVILESGERIDGRMIVVATDGSSTARLLNDNKRPGTRSSTCIYFAAEEPPISDPILILNGEKEGIINSVVIPTNLCTAYAPDGQTLITVNVLGNPHPNDNELLIPVRAQLREWFGEITHHWQYIRTYRIADALPLQVPPVEYPASQQLMVRPGLVNCGEYKNSASIQWALVSGAGAANAVVEALSRMP